MIALKYLIKNPIKALRYLITNPTMFFKKFYNRILLLYKAYFLNDKYSVNVTKWFKDNGDETLRFDYPDLNENSIVFDVGGYVGDFAKKIYEKYGCKVYIFEPHPVFYQICVERFSNNDSVIPLNYGLSDTEGEFFLANSVDGSSFSNPNLKSTKGINCKLKEFLSVMNELEIKEIDLMKINIEGVEYPLLMHLAKQDSLDVVKEYQIQFHTFIEDSISMRDSIAESLSKTHKRTWCYYFVWENWKKV